MSFLPAWVTEGAEARVDNNSYRSHFFLPPWAHDVLLQVRFDEDSDTAQDYSGRGRDLVYANPNGGGRSFLPTMIPGGGQDLIGAPGSGYFSDWDGMEDFSEKNLFFLWSGKILAGNQILMRGSDGNSFWRLMVNTSMGFEFHLYTGPISYKWVSGSQNTHGLFSVGFLVTFGSVGKFFFSGEDEIALEIASERTRL